NRAGVIYNPPRTSTTYVAPRTTTTAVYVPPTTYNTTYSYPATQQQVTYNYPPAATVAAPTRPLVIDQNGGTYQANWDIYFTGRGFVPGEQVLITRNGAVVG